MSLISNKKKINQIVNINQLFLKLVKVSIQKIQQIIKIENYKKSNKIWIRLNK
jgi:mevalonate kinase